MAERTLIVKVLGDTTNLEKNLGKATKTTKGFELSLKNLAKAAGLAFGAREVFRGLEDIIDKAEESQVSMAKLEAATKSSGVSMKTFAGELDKAQAAGRKLGFSNIETQGALAKLVVATQSGTTAVKDLSTAQDLARFKHIDVAAAAQMLSQAMTGSARAVKQLGINVIPLTTNLTALKVAHKAAGTAASQQEIAAAKLADKQATGAKIIEIVTQRLHGQADAYSRTTAGAMARFRAGLEDIEERIGAKVLPVMTRWVNYLSDHLPQIERFVKGVADKLQTLAGVASKVADAMGGWQRVLGILLGATVLNKVLRLAGAIGVGPGSLVGAMKMLGPTMVGQAAVVEGAEVGMVATSRVSAAAFRATWMTAIGAIGFGAAAMFGSISDSRSGASAPRSGAGGMMASKPPGTKLWRDSEGTIWAVAGKNVWWWDGKKWNNMKSAGGDVDPTKLGGGAKPYKPPQPIRPPGASIKRGYGGAGAVGGKGIEPSPRHVSTHDTRGLSGYPAFDYMVSGGTPVKAPEDGYIVGHSGHNPAEGPKGDIFAYSLYFYGVETHSMYFMTHLSDTAGDGYYPKGSVIAIVANWGGRSHVHVGVNKGSGRLSTPDRAPGGTGRLSGTHGFKSAGAAALAGATGLDLPVPDFSSTTRRGTTRAAGHGPFGKIAGNIPGAIAGKAPSPFGAIGGRIAADVSGATAVVGSSLDRMRRMIAARAAAIKAAIAKARGDVVSSFGEFSSGVMSAFDAINSAWKSPASQALAKMQAEDAMKSAVDAYAQAVKEFGADSPEAQAAARALEEAKLEAQAKAEEEAHDAKVKSDKDALEKQLAALEKEAAGAKTKAAAARIRKKINDLLASYGITPDTVAAATDWQTAQTLFVSSLGNLISSIDALTNAINGKGSAAAPGPPTSGGLGDRGTNPPPAGPPGAGGGGHPPPEFASGGAVPIMAHAGEYILRSSATRKIGVGNLNYMNRTGLLPSFQTGGLLDPTDSSGNPISMTSAVGSGVPYEIWRRKVAMAKYAKKEARISASRALWNPSRLPTPAAAADTLIDMWMEALGSDALFTERLGALKAFVDSGDAYRGGAVSRSWLTYGVPKLANGGYITRGGIAEVHRGETVTPAGAVHGPLVGELHVHNEVDEAHLVSKIGRAVYMLGIPS